MRTAIWLTSLGAPCFNFTADHQARLARELPELQLTVCRDEREFLAVLPQAELAIVWHFHQEWFAAAPRLRWLVTPAAGKDFFKITPPPGLGQFYGAFQGRLMGESALAMILGACRGVVLTALHQATDPWPRDLLSPRMRLLRGAHLVILGFGHIGEHVARLAQPFGCRITGVRRSVVAPPAWFGPRDRVATMAELDAILPEADHLMIILPSGAATDNLMDARRLALLPASAWLYNLGRGNCLDETALAAALTAGRLRGACLDVFQREPLPADSPLRQAPNVLLMPHASAFAPEYIDCFIDEWLPFYREQIAL